MNKKLIISSFAVPLVLAATVALHPGVASATPKFVPSGQAQVEGTYTLDPAHSSVGFKIQHLAIAEIHGRFTEKSGKLKIGADPTKSSVEVTIQAKSVDTAIPPRDEHLRTADFFEVEKYPTIKFKSTSVRKVDDHYVVDGLLTIKDVTKPVSIPFSYFGPITDPWGGTRIGAIAEPITINRKDFNVNYDDRLPDGTESVSSKLQVELSIEATLDK